MRTIILLLATFAASQAMAGGFERPVPLAQSATAEISYALACLAFLAALVAVNMLVTRR